MCECGLAFCRHRGSPTRVAPSCFGIAHRIAIRCERNLAQELQRNVQGGGAALVAYRLLVNIM